MMDKWSCTLVAFVCAALASAMLAPGPAHAATYDPATRVRVEGDQSFARLGISVASAGDVNGDGYGDVIVGAWFYDAGEDNEGAAFIFLGGPSGIGAASPVDAATRLESNQAQARFGSTVAGAGDVNNDGYDDVLVGAGGYDDGQAEEGVAFLYLGGPGGIQSGGPEVAAARFEFDQADARAGSSVAGAGDVNGDGFDDMLIGGRLYTNGENDEGLVLLFLGGKVIADGTPVNAAASFEGNRDLAHLGIDVAGAGDVNDDTYDDILLGAEWYTETKAKEGAAFLYLGGPSGIASGDPSNANSKLYGDQVDAELGAHVAAAGDVNADGYDDIVLGIPFYDAPLVDEGAALLYLGSASGIPSGGPSVASAILEGNQAGARFGESAASAGDANDDGFGDLLVGASRYDAGNTDEGVAFLFLGSASGITSAGATDASQRLEENQQGSYFGSTAAPAGDVNRDGYGDALIGTAFWRNPDDGDGAFFVYLGGAPAACQNGRDDDGDAAIDGDDSGCTSSTDAFEELQFADGAVHAITATVDDAVLALDGAAATVTTIAIALGGTVSGDLRAIEHSRVRVAGGSVEGDVVARDAAEAEIASGSVLGQVLASGAAHVTIRGGSVASIVARNTSRVDLIGAGFNFPLGDVGNPSGTLTGTLADGTPLAASFARDAGATIHLAPEPHAAALTLCSGLALGAVARRRSSLHAGRAVRYLSNP